MTTTRVLEFISQNWILSAALHVAEALLLTALTKLTLQLLSRRLRRLVDKTSYVWDKVVLDLMDGLKSPVVFLVALYFTGTHRHPFLRMAVVVATTAQVAIWGLHLIQNFNEKILQRRVARDPSASAAMGIVNAVLQGGFLVTIVLIALSNLGIDIGALIAGLGIGGIALALAVQNILGDLLASLSIVLDKPFVIGDFIVVGNEMGSVEYIGIKTTRVRSLSGEQLVFSNKDLLESRIRNFKRMSERRIVQAFEVAQSTPPEKLNKIPQWISHFVRETRALRLDRCHFAAISDSGYRIELVYWVASADFNLYMDLQQDLLIRVLNRLKDEGIELANPVRRVHISPPSLLKEKETPREAETRGTEAPPASA